MAIPNRRISETVDIGPFTARVGFHAGHPCEVFIAGRGKSGSELDKHLYALGVAVSKIMQGEEFEVDDHLAEQPETML